MALRVVAISAPDRPTGKLGRTLTSRDPASLFNACRYAAFLADNGIGPWGESNWTGSRQNRRKTILLMDFLEEDMPTFESLLKKERPNFLLIGAMTLCLPGAIACAQKAKEILGDKVCVVLGGWHATETIYFESRSKAVKHHASSPLRLIAEGHIKPLFDIVISGEGEYLIAKIGEIIDCLDGRNIPVSKISDYLSLLADVPGNWIIGWVESDQIVTIEGKGIPFDRNILVPICEPFGVQTSFNVFDGRLTAHTFSDIARGCVYDCTFCSERSSVRGPLIQIDTAAERLFRQFKSVEKVIKEDSPSLGASAFVEDSTLLAGSNMALLRLVDLLSNGGLNVRFGGQFTVDQVLKKIKIIQALKKVGFDYIFIGIETGRPESIEGMSKIHPGEDQWLDRAERAIEALTGLEIACGISLLFGMGESRQDRLSLFRRIRKWQDFHNSPAPISINWAVQHPLRGNDGGVSFRYTSWGTPVGPYLDAFQDFGEASLLYPIAGQIAPTLAEVEEVKTAYRELLKLSEAAIIKRKRKNND